MTVRTRDTRIEDVTGNHKESRTNNDVTTFHALNSATKYIPKRLGFVFPNLKTLSFVKTHLELIEFRDFKNMKKLTKLFLTENKIKKLPFCVFRYVEKLEIIDVSQNNITELNEDTFMNLPNLQQFIANENDIEHLEKELFRNNFNIKKISLSKNKLKVIDVNFMKLKGIELVDLRENSCISLSFGCCKGPMLRDFQNQTAGNCNGTEAVC